MTLLLPKYYTTAASLTWMAQIELFRSIRRHGRNSRQAELCARNTALFFGMRPDDVLERHHFKIIGPTATVEVRAWEKIIREAVEFLTGPMPVQLLENIYAKG